MKRFTRLMAATALMLTVLPNGVQAQNTEEIKVIPSKDLQLRINNTKQSGTGSAIEVRENTKDNHEYGFCGIMEFDLAAIQAKIAQGYTISDAYLRLTDGSNNYTATFVLKPFYSGWDEAGGTTTTYDNNAEAITAAVEADALATLTLKRYGGKKAFELQNASTQVNPFPVSSYQSTSVDNEGLIAYLTDELTSGETAVSLLVGREDGSNNGASFYTKEVVSQGLNDTKNCAQYQWSDTESKWVKVENTDNTISRIAAAMQFFGLTEEQMYAECAPQLTIVLAEPALGAYTVTIEPATNGTVVASKTTADEDDVVTLTVTPDENYMLGTLTVSAYTDGGSDTPGTGELARSKAPSLQGDIELTTVAEGEAYTFTMPAYNVKVTATFAALPDLPVAVPTYDYGTDNEADNKAVLYLGTSNTGYAANTKVYYTTDGTDPATSETRTTITATTSVTITAGMSIIRMIGEDSKGNLSEEVSFSVGHVRYLTVDKQWVTFCSPETYAVPTGLKAYTMTGVTAPEGTTEGTVILAEQTVIAKNTPMLLCNENAGTTTRFRISAADDVTLTGLAGEYVGVTETAAMPTGTKNYVLKNGVFVLTTATTAAAYSCYLALPETAATRSLRIDYEGDATGIRSVEDGRAATDTYYDLLGRPVSQPSQGLYIKNGKKIILK
ncbi:MAG: chitobiase/beta-hexosaminidase C-terminal domain-containing protein [Bacteroidaceae bacterium]|nr:chitobiase/beta-hexosaminidase C-terminal domain-containing protein [Bacteroidaceae bacterium]